MRKILKFCVLIILIISFGVGCSRKISEEDIAKANEYFFIGQEKYMASDYNGAIKDFDMAIKLNPKFSVGYHLRASAKNRLKDYKGGKKDLNKVINLNSKTGLLHDAYYGLTSVEIILGNYDEALKVIDKSIKVNSNYADAYFYRGMVKLYLKNHESAQKDFDIAVKLDPKTYMDLEERKKTFMKNIDEEKKSK